mmetsp:Transcript_49445/g.116878  ORF Transcript_49445/g.116878 Transcript_49445/m.116878 type:complete len:222 (-) Transcript_49445:131-796(-)
MGVVFSSKSGRLRAIISRILCWAPTKKQRSWWILRSIAHLGDSSSASSTPMMHWSNLPSAMTRIARANASSHAWCVRPTRHVRAASTKLSTSGSFAGAEHPTYWSHSTTHAGTTHPASAAAAAFAVFMGSPVTATISSAAMSSSCAAMSDAVDRGIPLSSQPATLRSTRPDATGPGSATAAVPRFCALACSPSSPSSPGRFDMSCVHCSEREMEGETEVGE